MQYRNIKAKLHQACFTAYRLKSIASPSFYSFLNNSL